MTDLPAGNTDHDSLLELLPDAIVGWDADRHIIAWNRAATALYGYTRKEALGRRPAELFSTHFPMPLLEIIETLADTGQWQGVLVQHHRDGHELTIESRWAARRDEHGRVLDAFSIDRDIAARLEGDEVPESSLASDERLRQHGRLYNAQRLESVGQLAAGISHDFNNILAIVINYAALIAGDLEVAQRTYPDERWASMAEDLAEIRTAAERAARLTHQLLAFSRQSIATPVPMDLGAAVGDIAELLRRTLGEQIELVVTLEEDLHMIHADPSQVEHALVNLAVNSRDAMPDGGILRIETANIDIDADYAAVRPELLPGPHVRLRVSDTGGGMSRDVVARVFEPFFTTKPVGEGTGLGLAVVFGMVRQAHGRAQFYSEPGVGTTFTALFPVVQEEVRSGPPAPVEASAQGVETILLVEDEEPLLEATRRLLTRAGYHVLPAPSGAAALKLASAHEGDIELLLTDVVMPGMRGNQLAVELRAQRPEVQVLFMSGFAGPMVESGMAISAADLIDKPFTAHELLARIAAARGRG
ncbi:MAG: response regulator [Solirubrobacteraceae bacterium]|jgi:PAS domain S-box-containing protein